jgi:hypothetical protein
MCGEKENVFLGAVRSSGVRLVGGCVRHRTSEPDSTGAKVWDVAERHDLPIVEEILSLSSVMLPEAARKLT